MNSLDEKTKNILKDKLSKNLHRCYFELNKYMQLSECPNYLKDFIDTIFKYSEQKSYIDIQDIREEDIVLNGEVTRRNNIGCFEVGDRITITEKIDGSNASIAWDFENKDIACFSRNKKLSYDDTLNGFYTYAKELEKVKQYLTENSQYIIFGEWMPRKRSNKICYSDDVNKRWLIFSIYNRNNENWMSPELVKEICKELDLEYIHELYNGEFISWEHCRSFLHKNTYGDTQEGVVVTNCSKIGSDNNNAPFILKIVNQTFKESMVKAPKEKDLEKEKAREAATELMSQIVTKNRVEKILGKLQLSGDLPKELTEKDMGLVAKTLTKAVYEDCMKEEKEVMIACGEFAGKLCSSTTMSVARKLILGE